jgi:tetratricopeptide (TPR) repeat protein
MVLWFPDSSAYEEWTLMNREQLNRLMLKALHCLADHHEKCGDFEQAQHYALREVELEPWQEEGHQQLMRALMFNGQRSTALAQYETCRRLLFDELGVEPSAETRKLYQQILAGTLTAPTRVLPPPSFMDSNARTIHVEQQVFVAREAELAKLEGFLENALDRHGQVGFITGEPGSGKTMLCQEFTRRTLTSHPEVMIVNGSCNAYTGIGDPYQPFLEIMEMLTGDVEDKWAGGVITQVHAKCLWQFMPEVVDALLVEGPELIDRFVSGAALLARVQSGAPSQLERLETLLKSRAALMIAASEQQINMFEQFTKTLYRLASSHSFLIIIDDLQWADAGSISLLFHLGRHLPGHRILILGTYRAGEVALSREGKRHPLEAVVHELQRDYGDNQVDLSQADGHQWIDALLDSEPNHLGKDFRETLFRHTNGLALFTVELLRGLQERGDLIQDEAGSWVEGTVMDWERLLPRVEAVIAESINRLPADAQSILSVASVEGEIFTAQAIARILGLDNQEIIQRLSGFLSRQQHLVSPAGMQRLEGQLISRYRFRHFLFQKYLYNRMEDLERVHLHEMMGRILIELFGEQSSEMAAQLARHFEIARLFNQAVKYYQLAGDRANRLSANAEAIAYYQHAIDLLNLEPDNAERTLTELRLRVALGTPLLALYGYTTPEIEKNYRRANELTHHTEPSAELFWVIWGLGNYFLLRCNLVESHSLGDELLSLSEQLKNKQLMLIAYESLSLNAFYEGDFTSYRQYIQQVDKLYEIGMLDDITYLAGADIEATRLAHSAWAYWEMGYPDQAREYIKAACTRADESKHPFSTCFAYGISSSVYLFQRDFQQSRRFIDRSMKIADEYHIAYWIAYDQSVIGKLLFEQGQIDEGLALLEQANSVQIKAGAELSGFLSLEYLAVGYAKLGRTEEGSALIEQALQFALAAGYRLKVPSLLLSKGDILLWESSGDNSTQAEKCYKETLDWARENGAMSWELRAALKLCKLWGQQGKIDSAYNLLFPIYSWFTEGFDTPDLKDASELLNELSDK